VNAEAIPCRLISRDGEERCEPLSPDAQAALFARTLHSEQRGIVEVAAARRTDEGRLVFASRRKDAADYLAAGDIGGFVARVRHHREAGCEVFASPLPRARSQPTNAAVEGGRVLWVDLDDVEEEGELAWVDVLRPHLLLSSGGGVHGYWLCDRRRSGEEAESGNRRLAAHLCGDLAVANRGRIMRVPGSVNHKRGRVCRIVRVDLSRPPVSYERLAARLDDPRPARGPRPPAKRGGAVVDDPALALCPAEYFSALCGVEPDAAGFVGCPLPDHDERTASCRLYEDHWWCFGCERGGGIYDLASLLEGGPWGTGLRGEAFRAAKERTGGEGNALRVDRGQPSADPCLRKRVEVRT
jgi:hypothetical protein